VEALPTHTGVRMNPRLRPLVPRRERLPVWSMIGGLVWLFAAIAWGLS
jgi:hypothetical protein